MVKTVTKTWKKRIRKINGRKRLVKVRKRGGREQVRIPGRYNATDTGRNRRK